MTTAQFNKLNKADKKHLAECFDGPPSKVTLARISATLQYHREHDYVCYDCNAIARKLGVIP